MTETSPTSEAPVTYGDLVDRFLAEPGDRTLAALRRAVRSAPGFAAELDATALADADVDLAEGRPAVAVRRLTALMPGALLSPSTHARLGRAFAAAGHPERARREEAVAGAALASILSTGDGTRDRPWTVLRVDDEYDVVRSRGATPRGQRLIEADGRLLDRIGTDDGDLWFDATSLVGR